MGRGGSFVEPGSICFNLQYPCCHREAARCFVSVASIVQYLERNFLLLVTSGSDLNCVLFSSSWLSILVVINKIHWCVAICAVNCTVDRQCCSHSTNIDPIAKYSSRIAIFTYAHLHSTPHQGVPIRILPWRLVWKTTRWWKKIWIYHERDSQTDRHRVTTR